MTHGEEVHVDSLIQWNPKTNSYHYRTGNFYSDSEVSLAQGLVDDQAPHTIVDINHVTGTGIGNSSHEQQTYCKPWWALHIAIDKVSQTRLNCNLC